MADPKTSLAKVPVLSDAKSVQEFLREPLGTIAAAVTGVLATGRSEFALTGGRILQAALKGKLYEQVGKEIDKLVEKGKLKEDYASDPLGFKSLLDLLEFIDSEVPDEDRLRAAKAMFCGVNAPNRNETERLVMYQFLKLSRNLSGSQIRTLAVIYEIRSTWQAGQLLTAHKWLSDVAARMGHNLSSLTELDESALIQYKLVSERTMSDKSGVQAVNGRLTDLGLKFCEAVQNYDKMKEELEKG
jgi:hypothetical protein